MPREEPVSAYAELGIENLTRSECELTGVALAGQRARLSKQPRFDPAAFKRFVAMTTAVPFGDHSDELQKLCRSVSGFVRLIKRTSAWLRKANAEYGINPREPKRRAIKTVLRDTARRIIPVYLRHQTLLREAETGLVKLLNSHKTAGILREQNALNLERYDAGLAAAWRRLSRCGSRATFPLLLGILCQYPAFRSYATEDERAVTLARIGQQLVRFEAAITDPTDRVTSLVAVRHPYKRAYCTIRKPDEEVFRSQLARLYAIHRYPDDEVHPLAYDAPAYDKGYLNENTLALLEADLRPPRA